MTKSLSSGLVTTASRPTSKPVLDRPTTHFAHRPSVLHVCTSCRAPGSPREPKDDRPGLQLYHALRARIRGSPLDQYVEVRPAECLSVCPRPCGIAMSSPGAWSYIFGDQNPSQSLGAIMDCTALYIHLPDGFMPRDRRPKTLRGSILGRVPPFEGGR